ncbi:MAG: cellulase family glycosylhydrolase [Chitinispirillaceae bacterium]|nr:cellulase family glycosylhydrolase [Chitinispirillaceae bacterium]
MRVILFFLIFTLTLLQNGEALGFSVSGTKLLDAKYHEFIIRGVNYAYAWYTGTINQSLPAIAKAGANAVRIVLADGGKWSKVSSSSVQQLINVCSQYKMVAVLEVHDATGDDGEGSLLKAAQYFADMAGMLKGTEDRVIINIANEWYGSWKTDPWAAGHKKAINVVRDAGLEHTIIVDAAGWGQYPASIHEKGQEVFDSDPLKNTMFSIHMYEYAGPDASTIKSNINGVIGQGLCLCIGEFGFKHTDGDVDEQYILDYCQDKHVGWLAWSWHGNGGGVEYLDLAYDASGSSFSDWGNTVINGRNGLKETSKTCSVFTDEAPGKNIDKATVTIIVNRNAPGTYSIKVTGAPEGATYDIQWYQSDKKNGTPQEIKDAAEETFTATEKNYQKYIWCEITGTGSTTGSKISDTVLVDISNAERPLHGIQHMAEYSMSVTRTSGGISIVIRNIAEHSSLNEAVISVFSMNGARLYRDSPASISGNAATVAFHGCTHDLSNGVFLISARIPKGRGGATYISEKVLLYQIQ